jgi:two-component system, sensor histidine kinase and response regulator
LNTRLNEGLTLNQKNVILIVDDEPSARDTLEALLFREGYELAFAANGQEALSQLDQVEPDLILLDVMMPGMDGFEVCRNVKSTERWRPIPITLITALDGKEELVRGLDVGADDFLSKPVNGLELRARVRSMLRIKNQYDELQATLNLREEMANMIVHDMRTPLTAIIGFSKLLLNTNSLPPEHLPALQKIDKQAHRLSAYLHDMLMLAKMKAGQPILNNSQVDLNRLLIKVAESHDIIARSKGIRLIIDVPAETRHVSLDANLFQRVLDNLMSNALKYSPSNSSVMLQSKYHPVPAAPSSTSPRVQIRVLDEGPGIPEEHRESIFEAYSIVALKQNGVSQVGLGLAFCRMVVEAHGGRIFVEPQDPQGSIFTVEI